MSVFTRPSNLELPCGSIDQSSAGGLQWKTHINRTRRMSHSFFFSLINQSTPTVIMRTTIAIAAAATFASTALAATNCNPSYNVAPSTPCFTKCNVVCI